MNRIEARALYLKIVLGALGISSYVLLASVLSSRPEHQENTLATMVRIPASLPSALPVNLPKVFAPAEKAPETAKLDTLAVSCWDSQEATLNLSTSARWVRLLGRSCRQKFPADSWEVKNHSNGFQATVFEPNEKQLTTDFIPLKEGTNEIAFRAIDEKGVAHQVTFTVERK